MTKNFDNLEIIKALRKESKFSKADNDIKNKIYKNLTINNRNSRWYKFFSVFKSYRYSKYLNLALILTFSLGSLFIYSRTKNQNSLDFDDSYVFNDSNLLDSDRLSKLKSNGEYKERAGINSYGNSDKSSVSKTETKSSPIKPDAAEDRGTSNNSIAPQATSLKGGEIDDNLSFEEYEKYILSAQKGRGFDINLSHRFLLEVVDQNNNPIIGESVVISDKNDINLKVVTDRDGKVWVYPFVYQEIRDNNILPFVPLKIPQEYYVNVSGKEYKFFTSDKTWKIQVDKALQNNNQLNLDLVFVIDTTGSMSDQINKLKETMQSISQRVQQMSSKPKIRYGMVLYRDKGDEYLTRIYDFTDDLDRFQKNLNTVEAGGGGDYAEDLNTALADTLEELAWSNAKNTVRLSFLIADAPPHMDYYQNYTYRTAMLRALEKGIKIFPLASSGLDNTEGEFIFRQIALITNAKYIFITNAKGGTDYHVGEQSYSVDKLDDLIVKLIQEELQ